VRSVATRPRGVRFSHVPVDAILRQLARISTPGNLRRYDLVARHFGSLLNPARVTPEEFRWLLSQGGEKEPRRVVEQFARWIRRDEMKCYRTGYDYKAHFKEIDCPMAVLFGDLDKIASAKSTGSIYRKARSEYRLRELVSQRFMAHLEREVLGAGELAAIVERIASRELDPYTAANDLLARTLGR